MSKQSEYDKHVEFVAKELMDFARYCETEELKLNGKPVARDFRAEMIARDIVPWITSKPVPWWKRPVSALWGRNGGE